MSVRLAISCGDVNGIGLRCLVGALEQSPLSYDLTLFIDAAALQQCIEVYHLPAWDGATRWHVGAHAVHIAVIEEPVNLAPGTPVADAARLAIASLDRAVQSVVADTHDAVVTLPINKHALQEQGWPYAGQTEMCAAACGADLPLMVLCTPKLRVALATVHLPVKDVSSALTSELIERRIHQLHNHLVRDIGIGKPRIAVLALNPHAGEHGAIGYEDQTIILPAVASCCAKGLTVDGPHPADGFFGFGAHERYDGVVAMYHDQGLIPLKLLAKGAGVNVTAGLSIVRTSPDHGTAYDRVSSPIDVQSTALALQMAADIVEQRRRSS